MKSLGELSVYLQRKMSLEQFIHSHEDVSKAGQTLELRSLTNDSRQVERGTVFVAVQGQRSHGLDYLPQVVEKGAAVVLADRLPSESERQLCAQLQVDFIYCAALKDELAGLADWFYDSPSSKLRVIGVTGTNGKTSTAFYCAQMLQSLDVKVGVIGTLGYGVFGQLHKGRNTTPDVLQVHRLLAQFVAQGVHYVVMEVSSHAIELGRIDKVRFATLALTQVSSDHLDFHGSQEAYEAAKVKLFHDFPAEHKILNLNDAVGQSLVNRSHPYCIRQHDCVFWGYQLKHAELEDEVQPKEWLNLCVNLGIDLQLTPQGMTFILLHAQRKLPIHVPLLGAFNAENLLCALSCVMANGFEPDEVVEAARTVESVEGRMQIVHQRPTVVVDFAHTHDALEKLLESVRQHQQEASDAQKDPFYIDKSVHEGRVWVVFGCGGDRDQKKRPLMGAVAERFADKVIVTSDNPRNEEPEKIIEQVLKGMQSPQDVEVIVDRQQAIEVALQQASGEQRENNLVVIAGKGHEDYQEIAGKRYPFHDASVVRKWFADESLTNKV
ncbi:UDP-N-acetylmuramoyl-L-alanyl-D-glutamate--2,6-diaminopimelate ligase [Thiomicrorhabdus sp. 6S3-12]|uniref:UDP-N-acetylmuramoyl-L-alanyl-D-glutamate--2, 6-diaminopimelate ligase n=1 Tax=Thiomicrorhabdus sp. 6S3-12 TaxID=2819681 RepID=UPI001AAD3D22|nr:UDP-N-acetylmuramoyl-L-alanyl-D-glutamate--2,6-diaminopimelate ligase [Thiomicrorhabdus sp. 6S3-12]